MTDEHTSFDESLIAMAHFVRAPFHLESLPAIAAMSLGLQLLDGIGAGIFGVVSVLVIADLTRGAGRFNLTLGAIATAVGIGAALSQTIAGAIVHHFGDRAGFLFLGCVAATALVILWLFMPETLDSIVLSTSGPGSRAAGD